MKSKPRICRNCVYCDCNSMKTWCIYWKCKIGSLAAANGCEKFESDEIFERIPIVENTKSGHND